MNLDAHNAKRDFATHVRNGLCESHGRKWMNPKFFYDKKGSRLFNQICLQAEYYLPKTEIEILERYSVDIVSSLGCSEASIIEFGSGDSLKTRIILNHFYLQGIRVIYFPIDISHTVLSSSVRKLSSKYKNLRIVGLSTDYLAGINKIQDLMAKTPSIPKKKVMFFLGSSIGNFEPEASRSFLNSIKRKMRRGYKDNLFVSFDLEKDIRILESAYNDKAGKTSEFNLNLLRRINSDLGGTFNLRNFSHNAGYNKDKKRIEMFIVSKCDQEVYVRDLDESIILKRNEKILTEYSYKYSPNEIRELAEKSGLTVERFYLDMKKWFALASFSIS